MGATASSPPGLVEIINWRLTQWRNQTGYTPVPDLDDSEQAALNEQDFIGWDNFCFGLVGNRTVEIQREYLSRHQNKTPLMYGLVE